MNRTYYQKSAAFYDESSAFCFILLRLLFFLHVEILIIFVVELVLKESQFL